MTLIEKLLLFVAYIAISILCVAEAFNESNPWIGLVIAAILIILGIRIFKWMFFPKNKKSKPKSKNIN